MTITDLGTVHIPDLKDYQLIVTDNHSSHEQKRRKKCSDLDEILATGFEEHFEINNSVFISHPVKKFLPTTDYINFIQSIYDNSLSKIVLENMFLICFLGAHIS